jgi:hypothetical protein
LSVDPDSALICEVVAAPANMQDCDAVGDLLHHEDGETNDANESEQPEVCGDSAYADGVTRELLRERFTLIAKVRRCTARPAACG